MATSSSLPGVRHVVTETSFELGRGEQHHLISEIERAGRGEYGPRRHTQILITFGEECTYFRIYPGITPTPLKKTG